jgi:ABC-type transporter Mla subunit MlaD
MRRRGSASIVANPILVGAVTVLVVVVAVFLAYNANNGLPFVPSQTLFAELPDGAEVSPGVEVREGGYRIGIVDKMRAERRKDGRVVAIVRLKLDEAAAPFPRDSRIVVRPRSPLALKIVQFERGSSRSTLQDGARIPIEQSQINTDLDELYTLYDAPTREGVRGNLLGFGDTFAGRGGDLATTISSLPALLRVLEPVMRNLADERTDLDAFFREIGDFVSAVAPVSRQFANTFRTQADTFDAIDADPQAFKDTISKTPPTLDASVRSFRVQRPFLRETALLSTDLNAASRELKTALPPINRAVETLTPVTARTPELNDELRGAMGALGDLASSPTTNGSLRGLTSLVTTLQPQLRFLGPYITVCNYWNIFWTFAAEEFTAPDPTGGSQRVLLNTGDSDQNDNASSSMGANEYATGRYSERFRNDPRKRDAIRQYIHGNVHGANAIKEDGRADCTPGQQGYVYGGNRFDDTEDRFYKRAVQDQLLGILDGEVKGSTFAKFDKEGRGVGRNRDRVPEGQTFTDLPGGRADLTDFDKALLRSRGKAQP